MKPAILFILLLSIICYTVLSSCRSHATPSSKPARKDTQVKKDPLISRDTSLMAMDTPAPARYVDTTPDPPGIKQISPADLAGSRIVPDTVINYEIDQEMVSLEGNDINVHYVNNIWKQADWMIFGESGQNIIRYQPVGDHLVKVEERLYHYYHQQMALADSGKFLDRHLIYLIDTSGRIHSVSKGKEEEIQDVFPLFKKYNPLVVKFQ